MKVFGLIGEKLTHSLSPIIHQYLYRILDFEATYSLYQVKPEHLKNAVTGIKALDLNGVNVTIPYKVNIMEFLDDISPEARKIGAVNTIHNMNAILTGYNTDYIGFGRMLANYNIEPEGMKAVVLGSGGAAKSIISYLEDRGISQLYIVTRDPENTSKFANHHRTVTYTELSAIKDADILINCTPVGMYPHGDASPVSIAEVSKYNAVVDLIYNPACTKLMQHAKDLGIPAYNGLYMLVAQAVAAVEIWIGLKISDQIIERVYQKLIETLHAQNGNQ